MKEKNKWMQILFIFSFFLLSTVSIFFSSLFEIKEALSQYAAHIHTYILSWSGISLFFILFLRELKIEKKSIHIYVNEYYILLFIYRFFSSSSSSSSNYYLYFNNRLVSHTHAKTIYFIHIYIYIYLYIICSMF